MYPSIRLLPDDFAQQSRALNQNMVTLYQQDDEHIALVKRSNIKKSLSTKISDNEAEILKYQHIYSESTQNNQVLKDLDKIFQKLNDGYDQNIIFLSTFNSVMGQQKKRIDNDIPNQRVPSAVEFAYCPHGPSVVTKLLEFLTLQYNKIQQINIEFNIFETQNRQVESQDPKNPGHPKLRIESEIGTRNIIFNQPAHPDTIINDIMPKVVKYAVSAPSILKLKIVSTDQYQLSSKTAYLQIGILPKICTDYEAQLSYGTSEFSFASEAPVRGQMMYPDSSVDLRKSKNQTIFDQLNKTMFRSTRSGISVEGQTLAEKIKEQKCSCLHQSKNSQLLIKDVGESAWKNSDRKFMYQEYTKVIQYTNNQIFNSLRQTISQLSSSKQTNPKLSFPFLASFRSSFTGQVPVHFFQFCNVTDSDKDTFNIMKMLTASMRIAKVQQWKFQQKIEYVQIEKTELLFLQHAAERASLLQNDFESLETEYNDYQNMSDKQINLLRIRGNCVQERGKLLESQKQEAKQKYLQKVQECLRLKEELGYYEKLENSNNDMQQFDYDATQQ